MNIYTDELRAGSKAAKVFLGQNARLDFLDEMQMKRELLMFLMDPNTQSKHIDFFRSFGSIDLDPGNAPEYIRALLNDMHLPIVEGEVVNAYCELDNVKERYKMLELIDNDLFLNASE